MDIKDMIILPNDGNRSRYILLKSIILYLLYLNFKFSVGKIPQSSQNVQLLSIMIFLNIQNYICSYRLCSNKMMCCNTAFDVVLLFMYMLAVGTCEYACQCRKIQIFGRNWNWKCFPQCLISAYWHGLVIVIDHIKVDRNADTRLNLCVCVVSVCCHSTLAL